MVTQREWLERARRENAVLAELTALTSSEHQYADVVRATLKLVEQLVFSPLLCLSIRESEAIGHYALAALPQDGVAGDVDPSWVEEAAQFVAEVQERRFMRGGAFSAGGAYTITSAAGNFVAFPADTGSGRMGALVLGAPEPPAVSADEEQLMLRLTRHIMLVLDHALLLREMREQETTDRLTGVATHRRLLDMLDYELAQHRHMGRWLALMLLDVEGLDGINRSYSHSYGNHVLQQLARLLREIVRPIDLVARCGSHDFAVMLPETNVEEVRIVSDALLERFMTFEFAGGAVGLSVGAAHARSGEVLTPEQLLRRAEGTLHEAKRQQREWSSLPRHTARRSLVSPLVGTRGRPG